jgi:hypothetical protein
VRVITTNAAGQDEWVGVDDIEVTAASVHGGGPGACPRLDPAPSPGPPPGPAPVPPPGPAPTPHPQPDTGPELTDLQLSPDTFMPARRGPAVVRRGRAGAALRFRLSRPALVRFEVVRGVGEPDNLPPKIDRSNSRFAPAPSASATGGHASEERALAGRTRAPASGGRFAVRGRRGLNRLRFSGRLHGRPLAPGAYVLRAVAVDRGGRTSAATAVRFRIGRQED